MRVVPYACWTLPNGATQLKPDTLGGHEPFVIGDKESFVSSYDDLIAGQFSNDLSLIEHVGGLYFGAGFDLSSMSTPWRLRLGRYQGKYSGHPVDIHGYWIYLAGAGKCWQAVERGGGALRYWNEDGKATGNPEDWELFSFEAVDREAGTVKISNASYVVLRTVLGMHPDPNSTPNYVSLTGNSFSCNDSRPNAAIFRVVF